MFINEKLIYLQLQKTASTHIAALLDSFLPGEQQGKHGQLTQDPGKRLVVGSIRNPWDWYVSLWAYGCKRDGAIRGQLTSPFSSTAYRITRGSLAHPEKWLQSIREIQYHLGKDHRHWRRLYSSPDDPQLFREWLRCIFSDQGKLLLMEEYPHLPMKRFAGLLTFRFMRLFISYEYWQRLAHGVERISDLAALYESHAIVDRFIRIESLERDLAQVLTELGENVHEADLKRARVNPSKRRETAYYYDDETIDLVGNHERFIIERFEYKPPKDPGERRQW